MQLGRSVLPLPLHFPCRLLVSILFFVMLKGYADHLASLSNSINLSACRSAAPAAPAAPAASAAPADQAALASPLQPSAASSHAALSAPAAPVAQLAPAHT